MSSIAILGDAWVVIRAITKNLKGDVKKGLDEAGKEADSAGVSHGQAYAAHFGDEAEALMAGEVGDRIRKSLNEGVSKDADKDGESLGKKIAKGVAKGFAAGLKGAVGGIASLTVGATVVVGLVGAIGALVGAVGDLAIGLVAVTAAAAPATAALGAVGAIGVGSLIQGLGTGIALFGTLKKKFSETTPEITAFKTQLTDLKTQFDKIRASVASDFFAQLSPLVKDLASNALPLIKTALSQTAVAFVEITKSVDNLFKTPLFQQNFAAVAGIQAGLIRRMGQGFVTLGDALVTVLAAAGPVVVQFGNWFKGWAQHIADLTHAGQETGKLSLFLQRAGAVAAQLGGIFKNLFGILHSVFSAASPLGAIFLSNFSTATAAVNKFLKTAEGAQKLKDYFDPNGQVRNNISAIWGLVKDLSGALVQLSTNKGIEQLATGLRQVLPGVTTVVQATITALGGVGKALGESFQTPAAKSGITGIKNAVLGLGTAFEQLGPAIGPLLQIIGDLGTNLNNVLGPAFKAISDVLPSLRGPLNEVGQALGTVLLAAVRAIAPLLAPLAQMIGELAKAFAGPLSSAIGAVGGLLKIFLDILGPIVSAVANLTPVIVALATAFAAMKVVSLLSGPVSTLSKSFLTLADSTGGKLSGALGRAGQALGLLGRGLPLVGIAIGLFSAAAQVSQQDMDNFGAAADTVFDKLSKGGKSAEEAQKALARVTEIAKHLDSQNLGTPFQDELAKSAAKAHELWIEMSPLEQATSKVSEWTATYTQRLHDLGPAAQGTVIAHQQLTTWTNAAKLAEIQAAVVSGNYRSALQLEADAIWGTINAQMAKDDATLAAKQSALGAAQAAASLAQLQKSGTASALDLQSAQLAVAQSVGQSAQAAESAAQKYAEAGVASGQYTSLAEGLHAGIQSQITSFEALAKTLTGPSKDAVEQIIGKLKTLDAQTVDPKVNVDTSGIDAGLDTSGKKLTEIDDRRPKPIVTLNKAPFDTVKASVDGSLTSLNQRKATSTADLYDGPFLTVKAAVDGGLSALSRSVARPVVTAIDQATGTILSIKQELATVVNKTVVIQTIYRSSGQTTATGSSGGTQGGSTRAAGGLINKDAWTTVGEEGRELVFLSRGQYVASYQKAQQILSAANIQARGLLASKTPNSSSTSTALVGGGSAAGGVSIPITVNPSAGMNEADLARKTGREFAWQFGRVT